MPSYLRFLAVIAAVALAAAPGAAASFKVDVLSDAPDASPGDGICDVDAGTEGEQCTLRAAIQEANRAGEASRIRLGPGVHTLSVAGGGEDLAASGDLDIEPGSRIQVRGRGEDSVIDADGVDRIFDVLAGAELELRGLTLRNGAAPAPEPGGAVRSAGHLVLRDCVLSANTATRGGGLHHGGGGLAEIAGSELSGNSATGGAAGDGGGAAYNDGATLEVAGSRFSGNTAAGGAGGLASGGAILNAAGTLTVSKSHFEANSAQSAGGGIASLEGSTRLEKVEMRENETGPDPGSGGAFHQSGAGDVTIERGRFEDNRADRDGGALVNGTGLMTVRRTRIIGNAAEGSGADAGGGGLFNAGGDLLLEGARVEANTADAGAGGGILNDGGTLVLLKSRVEDNSARRSGGGIASRDGLTQLEKARLSGNAAGPSPGQGGGLHLADAGADDGIVTVLRSRICGNTASTEGGGLWNSAAGETSLARSKVCDNTAGGSALDQGGGGLFNAGGLLVLEDRSRVSRNTATLGSGGGILNERGDLLAIDTSIDRNEARRSGGGVATLGGVVEEIGASALVDVKLVRNAASGPSGRGGGLHLADDGRVDVEGSRIERNEAVLQGGGLWNSAAGTTVVTGSSLRKNQAPEEGGPDFFNNMGELVIDGEPQP